jgi:hypothetical protein
MSFHLNFQREIYTFRSKCLTGTDLGQIARSLPSNLAESRNQHTAHPTPSNSFQLTLLRPCVLWGASSGYMESVSILASTILF